MNILIIEDEKPAANRLIKLLEPHFIGILPIANLDTVTRSVAWLSQNPEPDLIF
jgi:DNA-binding LytR/AlgR family response regulator